MQGIEDNAERSKSEDGVTMKDKERPSPQGRLGYELTCAEHAFRMAIDDILRPLELTAPQYAALSWIYYDPGISNAALARSVFVTPQTMHVMIAKLEARGLIKRSPDPNHGRILETILLPAGEAILSEAEEWVSNFEQEVAEALDPEAARHIKSAMASLFEIANRFLNQRQPRKLGELSS